jgi:hypothetical protein
MTKISSITAAEEGWKAVFGSGPEEESQSRIVAWGLTEAGVVVGLIVHPDDRRTITPATDVTLADGSSFDRYAFRRA